jgi:hypothetical protein
MPEMLRLMFNILAIISLTFFLATTTMWVRSYWIADRYIWDAQPQFSSSGYYSDLRGIQ